MQTNLRSPNSYPITLGVDKLWNDAYFHKHRLIGPQPHPLTWGCSVTAFRLQQQRREVAETLGPASLTSLVSD